MQRNRREFLSNVGTGMLVGTLGTSLASDLGINTALASEEPQRLTFGDMEPLVAMMQDTPLSKLQPLLLKKINQGTDLETLVAAGCLANARTFGGHDYIGYHTFMALTPSLEMSRELPTERRVLPVLKVLYRNTDRIHQFGGSSRERLLRQDQAKHDGVKHVGIELQQSTRRADTKSAEAIMASIAGNAPGNQFNHVQYPVQDETNVHRVVLAWRAWVAIDLVGEQHANTLLRQSVRFCLDSSQTRIRKGRPDPEVWKLIPKLLDQHGLAGKAPGTRKGDDAWVEDLSWTIFQSNRAQAAEAAAQALADGYSPDQIGEATSIAANRLLLHDPGRSKDGDGDKVKGSVHGASVGVHACDAANAWRNIARVSDQRNAIVSVLLGAYHSAGQSPRVRREPWDYGQDDLRSVQDHSTLLRAADEAVRDRNQARAAAAIAQFGDAGGRPREAFDVLLRFATSEDGALHAEKYFRTATEEFANTRENYQWRQLIALARVSASEYGTPAPGYREACDLIGVDA